MTTAVEIKDLMFTYDDGTRAIDNVSLTVYKGESVGIVGANGAGKSTLVNHLNGFHIPAQGSVTVCGCKLTKKNQEEIRRKAGLVFQNADDQLFMSRVYDDVMFGPQNIGIKGDELKSLVDTTLKDLSLYELRDRPPSHLSAGQKRFVAFATVLVMKPQILIMDEPTSDLDPRHRRKLINLVRSLDITRIVVSHDLDFIWEICGRVVVLSNGKVVADGPVQEILTSQELLEQNGLELPLRLQR